MNAADFLAAAESLPFGDLNMLSGGRGIVVVAPHPDDEALGCGGLVASACAQGIEVRVIVVSDGCGSHPNSRSFPPDRLRALRRSEAEAAVRALGLAPTDMEFLDLPDRYVPSSGAIAQRAVNAIVTAAQACDAGAICVTWRYDPHCDHTAAATLAATAAQQRSEVTLWSYPIWGWTLSPSQEITDQPLGMRLDVGPYLERKAQAIAAHRSQTTDLIDDDPTGFTLSSAMIERFLRPYEIFLRADL